MLKSGKKRKIVGWKNSNGYIRVNIYYKGIRKGEYIHRLVYQYWGNEGIKLNKYEFEVDHIDSNIFNNKIENLQYIHKKENLGKRRYNVKI